MSLGIEYDEKTGYLNLIEYDFEGLGYIEGSANLREIIEKEVERALKNKQEKPKEGDK